MADCSPRSNPPNTFAASLGQLAAKEDTSDAPLAVGGGRSDEHARLPEAVRQLENGDHCSLAQHSQTRSALQCSAPSRRRQRGSGEGTSSSQARSRSQKRMAALREGGRARAQPGPRNRSFTASLASVSTQDTITSQIHFKVDLETDASIQACTTASPDRLVGSYEEDTVLRDVEKGTSNMTIRHVAIPKVGATPRAVRNLHHLIR